MDFELECMNDFVEESIENLDELDSSFVELEKDASNKDELDSIFRAVHTMKGGARLIGMERLEKISHHVESLLDLAREGELLLDSSRITLLLETMDVLRHFVDEIRDHHQEPNETHPELIARLEAACEAGPIVATAPVEDEEDLEEADVEIQEVSTSEPATEDLQEEAPGEPQRKMLPALSMEPEAPAKNTTSEQQAAEQTVRIDVKRLDKLMDLVGELVLSRNQLKQVNGLLEDPALNNATSSISLITSELQDEVVKSRLQPISTVLNKFQRTVRDLAVSLEKEVGLVITGGGTELDRTLLEAIRDPLTHIIRNSVDHGIETPEDREKKGKKIKGTISIHCYHDGGQVVIEIKDDGAGLDHERISRQALSRGLVSPERLEQMTPKEIFRFIFHAGFSTAKQVTNLSGRGVGMDVVQTNIGAIGGQIDIDSTYGKGTVIRLQIPLTLAIIPALMIKADGRHFAIPQNSLQELIFIEHSDFDKIENFDGLEVFRLRGELLPLLRMRPLMKMQEVEQNHLYIVVLVCGARKFGLIVDEVDDTEEIVVKPLAKFFSECRYFSGAKILGNGSISLILDIESIASSKDLESRGEEAHGPKAEILRTKAANTALVFDIGAEEYFGVQMSQISRLDEIRLSDLESSGNQKVLQYRGGILPVVRLSTHMDVTENFPENTTLNLIVFGFAGREAGLLFREIYDVIELEGDLDISVVEDPLILGTMILKSHITLMLDALKLFEWSFPQWKVAPAHRSLGSSKPRLLYVDDSSFYLKMVSKYLQDGGFETDTALDGQLGLEKIKDNSYDLLIIDFEMPNMNGLELIEEVRKMENYDLIPIIVLTALTGGDDKFSLINSGIQGYLVKLNKEELLNEIKKLLSLREATA